MLCSRRGKLSLLRLVVAVALTFGWLFPLKWHRDRSLPSDYRLVSLNIQSQATDLHRAVETIRMFKPDFVCLQEIWHRPELEKVESLLPDYRVLGAASGEFERQSFNEGTFLAVRSDWSIEASSLKEETALLHVCRGDAKLVVVSIHAPRAKSFFPSGLRQTVEEQVDKSEELKEELAAIEGPIILAGDFNAPESGPAFKILGGRFHSAFEQAGSGLGQSFPSGFPVIRIDHVMGTAEVDFTRYETHDFGSDHLGLVASFKILP